MYDLLHHFKLLPRLETDVDQKSIAVLCQLEAFADPEWQQMSADWVSLPDCSGPWTTVTTATSTTASYDRRLALAMLSNSLIDILESLKVTRCIAETQL